MSTTETQPKRGSIAWKKILTRVAADAESHFDALKSRLDARLDRNRPYQIVPYRGYGTNDELYLHGRVLKQSRLSLGEDKETIWANMLQTWQRFETDEVPGIGVRATFGGKVIEMVTDEEGYFRGRMPVALQAGDLWHEIDLQLIDPPADVDHEANAVAKVIVPPANSAFGVISDVDDTVIRTNAASFLKMAWTTFINNAGSRMPFKGVAAFYRALHEQDDVRNPIFYLSSSPWNLYDLLTDFMEINDVPTGPLLLRDLGIDREKFIKTRHATHKLAQIEKLMRTYPDLPFILIGDSGQHDPEIFAQAVEDFPGRVRAIYIRDVSPAERDDEIQAIAARIREKDVELLLVRDSRAAAEHAAEHGYINRERLPEIESEYEEDDAPAGPLEAALADESA